MNIHQSSKLGSLLLIALLGATGCLHPTGRWVGTPGLRLSKDADGPVIKKVLPKLCKEAAPVLPGDIIIAIDDQLVDNLSMAQIKAMLEGPVGTNVKITVLRKDATLSFLLERIMSSHPERQILHSHPVAIPMPPAPNFPK